MRVDPRAASGFAGSADAYERGRPSYPAGAIADVAWRLELDALARRRARLARSVRGAGGAVPGRPGSVPVRWGTVVASARGKPAVRAAVERRGPACPSRDPGGLHRAGGLVELDR